MRERRPGVWEIRVVVGVDPVSGASVQRSFTVHGARDRAEARRAELVAAHTVHRRSVASQSARMTVGELLDSLVHAPSSWRPATRFTNQHIVRSLAGDRLLAHRLAALTPAAVEAAIARWQAAGYSVPTVSARWLLVRSSFSWAVREGLLSANPLLGMRGPARPAPRTHLSMPEVHSLLAAADAASAQAQERASGSLEAFVADQNLLLVRLAADSGARRGELAVLRVRDIDRCMLSISRGLSRDTIVSTKTGRSRRLTLGATTVDLITGHIDRWPVPDGGPDWLFSPDASRATHVRAHTLSKRFARVAAQAGVPDASLHRLRHSVATHLVNQGGILRAQARLGHRSCVTTLRHYAHAVALDDEEVAESLDRALNQRI